MRTRSLALLLLLATPLAAQSVEERLAKLEREMRELRAENEELRRQLSAHAPATPAPATTPQSQPVAVKASGKEATLSLGGFLHGQAETGGRVDSRFGDDNDRIYLRRVRVNANGKFAEHFDFRAEWELAGSLGNTSAMRAQLSDAYVTWTRYPGASVRIGQFKTPYGYEQLFTDIRVLTPERALGSDRIAPGRQVGIMLTGTRGRLTYSAGAFNGNGTNVSFNDDEGFLTVARLGGTLYDASGIKWTAGVNGFTSDDRSIIVAPELGFANNTFGGARHGWGIDTQVVAGPFEVWAELLRSRYEPLTGAPRDLDSINLLGAYSITPKWQAVARYETLDTTNLDTDLWTVGANYLIRGHDLKLQLHLMHGEEDDRLIAKIQTAF